MTCIPGWLAGPVVFGTVIDTTCRMWSDSCSGSGACALYDLIHLRLRLAALVFGATCLSTILLALALQWGRKKTDWSSEETTFVSPKEKKETEEPMLEQRLTRV